MTGFAAHTRDVTIGTLSLELRSVNHRYLELQVRIDEGLRAFEPMLRGCRRVWGEVRWSVAWCCMRRQAWQPKWKSTTPC